MARVHFAGVNTAKWAEQTEGRDVLISYADIVRRPGVWANQLEGRIRGGFYSSVILDSGAFTVRSTEGFTVDVEAYGKLAVSIAEHVDVVINLDDIGGDLKQSWLNQQHLESLGLDVIPVYHQGEPWSVLEHYIERHEAICVGFARKPGGKLVGGCKPFLDEFFAQVNGRVEVHGLAMTKWAMKHGYPFASVDSTTWIAEWRALKHDTLSEEQTKRDGTNWQLRHHVEQMSDEDKAQMVLDSYSDPSAGKAPAQFENHSAGQARSVLRRLGRDELARRFPGMVPGLAWPATRFEEG